MIAKYKTVYNENGEIAWCELVEAEFCCDEMKRAFEDGVIGFGDSRLIGCTSSKDSNINIYHYTCFPEGTACDAIPIRFCPFCGKEVKTIEVKKAKLVKKVVTVKKTEFEVVDI